MAKGGAGRRLCSSARFLPVFVSPQNWMRDYARRGGIAGFGPMGQMRRERGGGGRASLEQYPLGARRLHVAPSLRSGLRWHAPVQRPTHFVWLCPRRRHRLVGRTARSLTRDPGHLASPEGSAGLESPPIRFIDPRVSTLKSPALSVAMCRSRRPPGRAQWGVRL